MRLQREVFFVSGFQQRPNLTEVIELAFAHGAPFDLAVRSVRVIPQMDMEDASRVEKAVAVRKCLLARSARVVWIPCQAERLIGNRFEHSRRVGACGDIAATDIFQSQPEVPRLSPSSRFAHELQNSGEILLVRFLALLLISKREDPDLI